MGYIFDQIYRSFCFSLRILCLFYSLSLAFKFFCGSITYLLPALSEHGLYMFKTSGTFPLYFVFPFVSRLPSIFVDLLKPPNVIVGVFPDFIVPPARVAQSFPKPPIWLRSIVFSLPPPSGRSISTFLRVCA